MAQEESVRPRNVSAPSDPDRALTETQNWGARSHRELYDSVHTDNDPGRVGELAQEWTRLGQQIGESAQSMSERLRSTEAGWQGEAAAAARDAIQQLADWSRTAGETASAMGARIADQGRIMEVAKASMPEPVESDHPATLAHTYAGNDLAGFAKSTADAKVRHDQANAAHQQAVTVMQRMETDSHAVDGNTPRFTPPPNPIRDAGMQLPRKQANPDGQHLAATQSAWANQPGNNTPVGGPSPGNATPLGGSGDQPGGSQQQAAGSGSAAAVVPPPSGFPQAAPSVGEATTRAAAVKDKHQQGGTSGGDAKASPAVADGEQRGGASGGGANARHAGVDHQGGRSTGDAGTRAVDADHDAKGGDPNTRVPTLDDRHPSSTTSQGVHIAPQQTPNTGGDQRVSPQSPQIPVLGGSAGGGSSRAAAASRGPSGSSGASTGWSGSLPAPPSTPGGATSAAAPPAADNQKHDGGGANNAPAQPGMVGAGAASPMGASPMGMGAGASGHGGQKEQSHSSKYVEGGPVVEAPGADLPPPVIGEAKKKQPKQQG
jgi:hypothetical protein